MRMRPSTTFCRLSSWLISTLVGLSCSRENLLTLPAPAPAVAGTYVRQFNATPLPIPGDTIRLILRSVSSDTVDVRMEGISSGRVPVTVQYGRLPVVQDFSINACVSYVVRLNPGKDSSLLYMTCSQPNVLQYAASQRPYFSGLSTRFRKL